MRILELLGCSVLFVIAVGAWIYILMAFLATFLGA